MIHLAALPGTPLAHYRPDEIADRAVRDAVELQELGFDAVIIENMNDRPYVREVGPEVVATMASVTTRVRRETDLRLGIQVLAGANTEAIAVAHAGGADFVRVEGFVFAHVADEGLIEACAGPLLRYRKAIGAERVKILCDIKKKHSSHALTSDLDLAETARAAEFCCADGVVVTGLATGVQTDPSEVESTVAATKLPVWVGSGITPENIASYPGAQGLIVGSWLKRQGEWENPINRDRAARIVKAFKEVR